MARVRMAEHVPWTSLAPSADVTADRIEISRTGSTVRLRASNVTTLASAGGVCVIPTALRPLRASRCAGPRPARQRRTTSVAGSPPGGVPGRRSADTGGAR